MIRHTDWDSLLNNPLLKEWVKSAALDEPQPAVRVALLCLALEAERAQHLSVLAERDDLREMLAEAEELSNG